MVFNCLLGIWEVPWSISGMVKKINGLRGHKEVAVQHTLREGNKVADYSANLIFFFTGTTHINFLDIHQAPK